MTNETSLKEVEKKTYMSYHQDGLIDIFIGIYALLFGAGIIINIALDLDMGFLIPAIFPVIMIPYWNQLKKKITMPRIGFVKFRRTASNRMTMVLLGLMVAGIITFMGLTFTATQSWALPLKEFIASYYMIIIGISAATVTSLFAYTLGLKRFNAYGILTLVLFVTGHFITVPFEYFPITIGLVIILNGAVLLKQFTQKYPIQ